jgi:hypothetical protein
MLERHAELEGRVFDAKLLEMPSAEERARRRWGVKSTKLKVGAQQATTPGAPTD